MRKIWHFYLWSVLAADISNLRRPFFVKKLETRVPRRFLEMADKLKVKTLYDISLLTTWYSIISSLQTTQMD